MLPIMKFLFSIMAMMTIFIMIIPDVSAQNGTALENASPSNQLVHMKPTQILPLKQFQAGIEPKDVKCQNGLILAIKAEDGSPACINPDDLPSFVMRGWAVNPISRFLEKEYSTQEQQNQLFYSIMNLTPLRDWSKSGWQLIGGNSIDDGSDIHFSQLQFYLPPNTGNPTISCDKGWHADVVIDTRKLTVVNATYPQESDCANQTAYVYREMELQPKGPNESVPIIMPNPMNVIHVQDSNFTVLYNILGGGIRQVEFDKTRISLVISLTANNDGDLTMDIPRALLDSRSGVQPYQFLVLVDDHPIRYVQTSSLLDNTLTIPFSYGSTKIEIAVD